MNFSYLKIVNDVKNADRSEILSNIHNNTMLSVSYIIMLSMSAIICTLGLIMNSPAIVIGGMIIAPLMWPLMKIAAGVSLAKRNYITQATILFGASVLITLVTSFMITIISPIKVLNSEILARTQPTLLDIIVALAAGTVAALGVFQKKISSSLAGVAIATSLVPPLCVGGIGMALQNQSVAIGGIMLFIANVVSIIFIAIFVFRYFGLEAHEKNKLQTRGTIFVAFMLILTALPLFTFLKNYSFETMAYQKTENILKNTLQEISPSIYVENVKTNTEKDLETKRQIISVEADVLIPESLTLDFKQKEQIIEALEDEFKKDVSLNLKVQRSIDLQTETDITIKNMHETITKSLKDSISEIDATLSIDELDITQNEEEVEINTVLIGDPSINFTEDQRKNIEEKLEEKIKKKIKLNIEIISRITLRSQPDILIENINSDIKKVILENLSNVSIINLFTSKSNNDNIYDVDVLVATPEDLSLNNEDIEKIEIYLNEKYEAVFNVKISTVEKISIE